mgnify:CR=1 FL=1
MSKELEVTFSGETHINLNDVERAKSILDLKKIFKFEVKSIFIEHVTSEQTQKLIEILAYLGQSPDMSYKLFISQTECP